MKNTLIISYYDSGYNWSVNLEEKESCRDNDLDSTIIDKYEEIMGENKFAEYIFENYPNINNIIICENGSIEVFDRFENERKKENETSNNRQEKI